MKAFDKFSIIFVNAVWNKIIIKDFSIYKLFIFLGMFSQFFLAFVKIGT